MGSIPATLDITAVRQKKIKTVRRANKSKLLVQLPTSPRFRASSFAPSRPSLTLVPELRRRKFSSLRGRKLSYERKKSISLTRSRRANFLHTSPYFKIRTISKNIFFVFSERKSMMRTNYKKNSPLNHVVAEMHSNTFGKISQFSPLYQLVLPANPTFRNATSTSTPYTQHLVSPFTRFVNLCSPHLQTSTLHPKLTPTTLAINKVNS